MNISPITQIQDETTHALSLRDIASWDLGTGLTSQRQFRASVPALQRGLVWSPQQIEMLWDSILRGFPIGALVVCRKIEAQERGKVSDVTHHLLDGQQRCNAIALGFTDPFPPALPDGAERRCESIIWLDLHPEKDSKSTRNYLARVTTLAHPWGYTKNDNVERISTFSIRDSLSVIGVDPADVDYKRPLPLQLWPKAATAPIPLAWILLAPGEDQNTFWRYIGERVNTAFSALWTVQIRRCAEEKDSEHWTNRARRFLEDGSAATIEQRDAIYRGAVRANSARIIALNAPQELLEVSRQEQVAGESTDPISNIEHLFQRLNRQGTPLDGEELAYSMIKAYWPELADPIDQIAHGENRVGEKTVYGRMPASRMVSIGVRAALAQDRLESLPAPMPISVLRSIAQGHDSRKQLIYEFIRTRLAGACARVDAWLQYHPETNLSGLLPVHLTSIALSSPDAYLLLLCFADRLQKEEASPDVFRGWSKCMQGLATLIHWFGADKVKVANLVYGHCKDVLSVANIQTALKESIAAEALRPVHAPTAVESFVRLPEADLANWRWLGLLGGEGESDRLTREKTWWGFLSFRENRELLLYAQRGFLAKRFSDYDPARKDLWESHNRPWDFDHILASKYLYWRKGGDFKGVCYEWSNTIGNFRAWPFEDNRSDRAETAEEKIKAENLDNSFLAAGEEIGFSGGERVRHDEASARVFVTTCRERLLRIYRTWYESVEIADLIIATEQTEGTQTVARAMSAAPE